MAFDGVFLRQIIQQLSVLEYSRINKIFQISDTEILFHVYGSGKSQLMISCHSRYNRIHLTTRSYPTRSTPSNFIMLLRKYLEGGTILSIRQAGLDRYLVITVGNRNEIGDKIELQLYVELMGKYANLILVYQDRIIDALKRIPPFENTRRTIQPGAVFKVTDPQSDKLDPFEIEDISPDENLFEKLTGFSPLLSDEFHYRMINEQSYRQIIDEVRGSSSIYITEDGSEELFHCIPLTHLGKPYKQMEICAGLDYIYFTKEEHERIRQLTGDLFKFTRREIKKGQQKIERLNVSLEDALNCDRWRQYGDTLYANIDAEVKGLEKITLNDYEGNPVEIPLDPKLDVRGNARKCFQKYRKGATGQKYIREQLQQAEETLSYFQMLQYQLQQADFDTATEIRQELESQGYLKARRAPARKKKGPSEPNYTRISFKDKTIYLGKNNIQNDFVTFRKAGRNDCWFHVKDMHGSHVVITTDKPDEEEIRLCAQLAAYYSTGRQSSSIPVNYTLVRNLKKIPGSKTGKVTMSQYNTIYIDIDEDYLNGILNKNGRQ